MIRAEGEGLITPLTVAVSQGVAEFSQLGVRGTTPAEVVISFNVVDNIVVPTLEAVVKISQCPIGREETLDEEGVPTCSLCPPGANSVLIDFTHTLQVLLVHEEASALFAPKTTTFSVLEERLSQPMRISIL